MRQRREVCYVCERKINGKPEAIGGGLYRHPRKCRPGSKRWMESNRATISPMTEMFVAEDERQQAMTGGE